MRGLDPSSDIWHYASSFLPSDLDALARSTGAVKRLRAFESCSDLLRTILSWAQPGGSLCTTCAWAKSSGLADIQPESLFYRVQECEVFLEALLAKLILPWRTIECQRRLVITDATVLAGPNSRGTDWRVHMLYDPLRAVPCGVQVTDNKVGESFGLHELRSGDLVVGDRGYGYLGSFREALSKGADVLVRVASGQIRLLDESGGRVYLKDLEQQVPVASCACFNLIWRSAKRSKDRVRVRLIGVRTVKNEVCWLVTNLDERALSNEDAAEIYRYRWQIELLFKRLKTQLELGDLRSREGPTAKSFILAKLITAVLALKISNASTDFSPYGYRLGAKAAVAVA